MSAMSHLYLQLRCVMKHDDLEERVQEKWLMWNDNTTDIHWALFNATGDICAYWQKVLESNNWVGCKKDDHLTHFAKTALTSANRNAVPERGFSINNLKLGKEASRISREEYHCCQTAQGPYIHVISQIIS